MDQGVLSSHHQQTTQGSKGEVYIIIKGKVLFSPIKERKARKVSPIKETFCPFLSFIGDFFAYLHPNKMK